tara:strand:+ start:1964 stop:2131 length:168 start_codon:yes stop_codon:yes gene_type:complete
MNYAKLVAEITQECIKVIHDNKEWVEANNQRMDDMTYGYDNMARNILAIIERDKE